MAEVRKEQECDELHRPIWAIADELHRSVAGNDGFDFALLSDCCDIT